MPAQPFSPRELKDGLLTFEAGVNNGIAPELVPRNQLANAMNTSLRGDYVSNRPYFKKRPLNYYDPAAKVALDQAWIQAAAVYTPDSGKAGILVSGAGRLYQLLINDSGADVIDVTGGHAQDAAATQCWIFQAEKWAIWNDGKNVPVFFDGGATALSNYGTKSTYQTFNTAAFTIPALGTTVTVALNTIVNLVAGDILQVQYNGQFQVIDVSGGAGAVVIQNLNATPVGRYIPIPGGDNMYWQHTTGFQLPPGRMGAYGKGRVWMALTDGKQFVAGDQVGGSSGTQAENFRDAVLQITENLYLAGGGYFAVPGTVGEINAMKFAATLDASLGQGALMVFTRNTVFSCNTPVQRTEWQDVTSPILTETALQSGATGQDSTTAANSDTIMRSLQGLTSLILARREFNTWGVTPISHEVGNLFALDSQDLLPWASSIVFDNRYLQTVGSVLGKHGVYFKGLVPINFDPVSGLRGKQPSIYDARLWQGLNIYKLIVGTFNRVTRAFALCWNEAADELELYEILPSQSASPGPIGDNDLTPVPYFFESGTLDFGQADPRTREYKQLKHGEIWVDHLKGTVHFQAWYKPDQWPYWVLWHEWEECAMPDAHGNGGFRPRMSLGEPSAAPCDHVLNRPLREGYTFRFRLQVTGNCAFKGAKFVAVTKPEPPCPGAICSSLCPT